MIEFKKKLKDTILEVYNTGVKAGMEEMAKAISLRVEKQGAINKEDLNTFIKLYLEYGSVTTISADDLKKYTNK